MSPRLPALALLVSTLLVAWPARAEVDPPLVAATAALPMEMAVAGARLFVRSSTSSLTRIGLDDGAVDTLVATGVTTFTIRGDTLFYAVGRELWRMDLDGGAPRRLAEASAPPVVLAADGADLYFVTLDRRGVFRAPVDGGAVETVSRRRGYGSLAVDARYLYVGNWSAGTISRIARRSGKVQVLARKQRPVDLHVEGGRLLWTSEGGSQSVRTMRAPATRVPRHPAITVLGERLGVDRIEVYGGHVYWQGIAGDGQRSVARAPVAGGEVEVLSPGLPFPGAIAVGPGGTYVGLSDRVVVLAR